MGCWTDRETLLEINLQKQKIKRVKQLLSKGANPDNYSEDYKCSLLSIAISQRNEAMVRIMLKAGASTNQNIWHSQHDCKPSSYEYPLHIAVFQGSMGIIKALVEHGANVDIGQDSTIGTPLHQAAKQGHKEVTAYLLSKNADIIAIDRNLNTPLHTAALYGYEAVAKVLLLKRAPVNAKNSNLSTPLHCAASAGAFSVTKLLLEHGASVSLRDFANKTPLDLAKNESIRNLLKQHNLNHTQQESHVFGLPCTALH
uniref:Uncharacterized protein n=1 Tax=Ciona intestinalis TaxID=7719 RepID=H2XNJ6_CIOIN